MASRISAKRTAACVEAVGIPSRVCAAADGGRCSVQPSSCEHSAQWLYLLPSRSSQAPSHETSRGTAARGSARRQAEINPRSRERSRRDKRQPLSVHPTTRHTGHSLPRQAGEGLRSGTRNAPNRHNAQHPTPSKWVCIRPPSPVPSRLRPNHRPLPPLSSLAKTRHSLLC